MRRSPRRTIEFLLYASGPVVAIVTTPFLARGLGPDARGLLGLILTVTAIATMLGNLGQAELLAADGRSKGPSRVSVGVGLAGGLVAGMLAGVVLGAAGVDPASTVIASLAIPFLVAVGLLNGLAIAARDTVRPAIGNWIAAAVRLVLIPLLAVTALLSLPNAVAILLFGFVLGASVALLPYAPAALRLPPRPASRSLGSTLRAGSSVVAFGAITAVTLRADLFAVALLGDPVALGTYAAVVAVGQAGLALSAHFKSRVQAAAHPGTDTRRRVAAECAPLLGLCATAIIGAVFLAEPVAAALFGPEFPGSADLLRVVAFSASAQLVLDVVHGLLMVLGLRRQLVLTASIGAVTTLALLAVLVPPFGPIGAALATAVAASTATIVGGAISWRALAAHEKAEVVPA